MHIDQIHQACTAKLPALPAAASLRRNSFPNGYFAHASLLKTETAADFFVQITTLSPMTFTRALLLAAVLLAVATRAAAGTAAIDLDLEEVHCPPPPFLKCFSIFCRFYSIATGATHQRH